MFTIQFDAAPLEALDQFALLAVQNYNLGSADDWFGEFRGGLFGFYTRLNGIQRHYYEIHAWLPRVPEPEYHLASIFFHMDSALECLTYALNALGWIVRPAAFRNVTDAKELMRIGPRDILGDATKTPPRSPLAGYQAVFPTLQGLWQRSAQLISRVQELHDVSKHRRTIFVGGKCRTDPPLGFYEALGVPEEPNLRAVLWPMAEIILKRDPKLPRVQRTPPPAQQQEILEDLVPTFATFVKNSGEAALADAQANVPLKEKQFRK